MKLKNESKRTFVSISSEQWRKYSWENGITNDVLIDAPLYLSWNDSGHYVLDSKNVCHFIPYGWVHLSWLSKANYPHFVA